MPVPVTAEAKPDRRKLIIAIVAGVAAILMLVGLVFVIRWMAYNPEGTRTIRDIFIIFLALMSTLVVAALVILVALVARLILMLQNEIRPLLETISETLHTLRGTAVFMSENVVQPVVQTAGLVEGARRFVEVLVGLRPSRKKRRP